ncbi:helix-turn-helix transcriptional regulator [Janthinobacterium sp. HLX7-2]|uniref:helix-turn-helix transcriptional regulator n=1 Tax=Janthinobacterium sp. HLX7-2 TaxID=1259331 RepID=UPI003F211B1C
MNYTSKRLDNKEAPQTTERILYFIKTKGPVSTATVAKTLEMTGEAARQQVQKLVAAGLIEGRQEGQAGAGRPRQNWVLTQAGNARFPDTHAQLTVKLIGSVRQLFGEAGLDKLIMQREEESRSAYALACPAADLPTRLQQLAAVRDEEGYMARVEADGEDWLLIEDHCPICAAARTCQGFCRSELQLFQEVVGPTASIVREQHLLTNALRCIYRISPLP